MKTTVKWIIGLLAITVCQSKAFAQGQPRAGYTCEGNVAPSVDRPGMAGAYQIDIKFYDSAYSVGDTRLYYQRWELPPSNVWMIARYSYEMRCAVAADGPTMCTEKTPDLNEPEMFDVRVIHDQFRGDGVEISVRDKADWSRRGVVGFIPCQYTRY